VVEALIKAGAFDSTGAMRRALMDVLEKAIELGQDVQRDKRNGQLSIFGGMAATDLPRPRIGDQEWTDAEMLAYEKATLGFYITKHPLAQYEELVKTLSSVDTSGLGALAERYGHANNNGGRSKGPTVIIGGLLSKIRPVAIRQGRSAGQKMLVLTIEDFVGSVEAIAFPDMLDRVREFLKPDSVLFFEGELDTRREEPCIRLNRVIPLAEARRRLTRRLVVSLRSAAAADLLPRVRETCAAHPGRCPLYFEVDTRSGERAVIQAGEGAAIDSNDELVGQLGRLVGPENVRCVGPSGRD
jgi:DNA polymerase-3 subunit alpha